MFPLYLIINMNGPATVLGHSKSFDEIQTTVKNIKDQHPSGIFVARRSKAGARTDTSFVPDSDGTLRACAYGALLDDVEEKIDKHLLLMWGCAATKQSPTETHLRSLLRAEGEKGKKMETEIQALKNALADKEEELRPLREGAFAARAKERLIDEMNQEIKSLKETLAQNNDNYRAVCAERNTLRKLREEDVAAGKEKHKLLVEMQWEVHDLRIARTNLEQALNEAYKVQATAQKAKEENEKGFQEEIAKLWTGNGKLREENEKLQEEIVRLKNLCGAGRVVIALKQADNEFLTQTNNKLRAEYQDLKAENEKLKEVGKKLEDFWRTHYYSPS